MHWLGNCYCRGLCPVLPMRDGVSSSSTGEYWSLKECRLKVPWLHLQSKAYTTADIQKWYDAIGSKERMIFILLGDFWGEPIKGNNYKGSKYESPRRRSEGGLIFPHKRGHPIRIIPHEIPSWKDQTCWYVAFLETSSQMLPSCDTRSRRYTVYPDVSNSTTSEARLSPHLPLPTQKSAYTSRFSPFSLNTPSLYLSSPTTFAFVLSSPQIHLPLHYSVHISQPFPSTYSVYHHQPRTWNSAFHQAHNYKGTLTCKKHL